jgi:hypothetical protein
MSKKPGKIPVGDRHNFQTLQNAHDNGELALVSAIRKSDGKQVSLVCAMQMGAESIVPVPVAVMIEGNPYELFEDPTIP